jgi:hypothetical protein
MAGRLLLLSGLVASVFPPVLTSTTIFHPENHAGLSINGVPAHVRETWMRMANEVRPLRPGRASKVSLHLQAVWTTGDPCPQAPFGSVIVNTTSNELVCVAANKVTSSGGDDQFVLDTPGSRRLIMI